MLSIRLQRLGRKGYPVYRIAVQEAQRHPSSGRVVAYAGSYNPHTKQVRFDKEKTELYLKNGAQPSPHVIKLMVQEKISMPSWVKAQGKKDKKLRNPDKLRRNQPEKPVEEAPVEVVEEPAAEAPNDEAAAEETPAPEKVEEAPAETTETAAEPDPAPEEPAKPADKTA